MWRSMKDSNSTRIIRDTLKSIVYDVLTLNCVLYEENFCILNQKAKYFHPPSFSLSLSLTQTQTHTNKDYTRI